MLGRNSPVIKSVELVVRPERESVMGKIRKRGRF